VVSFSTFSLNTQMSRVLFWGVWGGGVWKWILGNKKRVGFIGRSLWKATKKTLFMVDLTKHTV
jgi:hypothetical protein